MASAETKERKQVLLDTFGGSIVVVDSSSPDFTASVTAATNSRGVGTHKYVFVFFFFFFLIL